jgi:hypothetical protein
MLLINLKIISFSNRGKYFLTLKNNKITLHQSNLEQKTIEGSTMNITIPKDVVEKTTKCHKDCLCMSNGNNTICPVIHNIAGKVLFVRPKTRDSACTYKMSFGNSFVCNCPTRREIYIQYKI